MKFTFKTRSWVVATAVAMLGAVVPADAIGQGHPSTQIAAGPAACTPSGSSGPLPLAATTIGTIRQAYSCILDHYYNATALDDRRLLDGAFAGFTQELDRLGLEQADATMPALSGDHDEDWSAFATVYERVTNRLRATATVRQAVASATMTALVDSLGDDHAGWQRPLFPPSQRPGELYGIGLTTSPAGPLFGGMPAETLPPLYVASVLGGPAAAQDVRPGDVIEAVDNQSPFLQGMPNPGVGSLLNQRYPQSDPIRLTLRRPSTGRTRIVTLKPMLYTPTGTASQAVTSILLSGNIAGIQLRMFAPGAADAVFKAIADLGGSGSGSTGGTVGTVRGIVLDLRGDGGGSPLEVAKLLGAFVHGAAWSYDCTTPDRCDVANRTDATVPLLRLPLVVLTDRSCASACDAFSGAVKDLHVGTLVGTRTAGVVAGQALPWWLGDGSALTLPSAHEVGADHEMIDGIGVAPDIYLPTTPEDLSSGHDAVVAKAVSLLEH